MTKSYPVTLATRAAALTAVMRRDPPKLRFTRGMALAAQQMEREHDRKKLAHR